MKRVLSMLMALVLVFTMLPLQALATEPEPDTSVDTGDLTMEGTNGFGTLLSQEIQESQEESAEAEEDYEAGYSVIDLTFEGSTATVEYSSMEEAILVVAVYSEDGLQMLASGDTVVSPDENLATVTIQGDMPEYFMASAYLMDTYDLSPLCKAYDTPMYTREMQELLASTVDDYDPEKVLNLDEDDTNNFAVIAEDVIMIEKVEGVNIVSEVDEENAVYVIDHADERITGLEKDSIFIYSYEDENILIVKVDSISVEDGTATIYGGDLEINEVFSQIKIKTEGDMENSVVDEENGPDSVKYMGRNSAADVMTTNDTSDSDTASDSFHFAVFYETPPNEDNFSVIVKGDLYLDLDVEFEY